MYYIVEENTFNEKGHARLLETLDRFSIPYEVIKVKPFIEELEFETDRKDVFCFGSVKMSRLAKKYNWNPGALMTKNHNFLVYRNHYHEDLLNYDSRILQFGEDFPWTQSHYFIRPCEDTKTFAGQVFDLQDWFAFWHGAQDANFKGYGSLDLSTLIQVAPVKLVQKEYRLWIVDGKIVTASLYKMNNRPLFCSKIEPDALKFGTKMIEKFELADAFVMDVCLHKDEWKIVECGCINSAGFYEADMQMLVNALEKKFKQ